MEYPQCGSILNFVRTEFREEDNLPPKKRKVPLPDGRTGEATIMPFQVGGEHWNEYLIDDGTVIRVKPVLMEVLRVDGEYDPQGNPAYVVQAQMITFVSAPEELRREGQ